MTVNPLNAGTPLWDALPYAAAGPTPPACAPERARAATPLADKSSAWFSRSLPARLLDAAARLVRAEALAGPSTASHAHAVTHLDEHVTPADSQADATSAPASLEIYLLSPFRVFAADRAVEEWPNGKSKAIFKYLATHRSQPVPKEVLMGVFWPESDQDAARNNLNVAIYGLRKTLARADPDRAHVLFRQGCYSFNPELRLWIDAEAFVDCVHSGQAAEQQGDRDTALAAYRLAEAIYRSPLLVEDRYEDWLVPQRQALQDTCQRLMSRLAAQHFADGAFDACAAVSNRRLDIDPCDEEAHRLLMRCYSRLGHAHLALRQYHFCVDALARELNLIPSPQTVALSRDIRRRLAV